MPPQPIANPNYKPSQHVKNMELRPFPTYVIIVFPVHEIQLDQGKQLIGKS